MRTALILLLVLVASLCRAEAPTLWTVETPPAEYRFKQPIFVFDGSQVADFVKEAAGIHFEPFETIAKYPDRLWIRALVDPKDSPFYLGGLEELVAIGCADTFPCLDIFTADCTKPNNELRNLRPGLPWSETRINGKNGIVFQIWCAFPGKCEQIQSVQLRER